MDRISFLDGRRVQVAVLEEEARRLREQVERCRASIAKRRAYAAEHERHERVAWDSRPLALASHRAAG